MAKVKRIFSDDYLFRGKYVAMVNDLTTEIDPHSGATIFNSAVELYLTAAIVGAHYQLTAIKQEILKESWHLSFQIIIMI